MWRKANLRRLIRTCRRFPQMGLAGFVIGLLYGAVTNYFDRLSGHLNGHAGGAASRIFSTLFVNPLISAALVVLILIWLSGTLRFPRKPYVVFLICLPVGIVIERLLSDILGAIVRTTA